MRQLPAAQELIAVNGRYAIIIGRHPIHSCYLALQRAAVLTKKVRF